MNSVVEFHVSLFYFKKIDALQDVLQIRAFILRLVMLLLVVIKTTLQSYLNKEATLCPIK